MYCMVHEKAASFNKVSAEIVSDEFGKIGYWKRDGHVFHITIDRVDELLRRIDGEKPVLGLF